MNSTVKISTSKAAAVVPALTKVVGVEQEDQKMMFTKKSLVSFVHTWETLGEELRKVWSKLAKSTEINYLSVWGKISSGKSGEFPVTELWDIAKEFLKTIESEGQASKVRSVFKAIGNLVHDSLATEHKFEKFLKHAKLSANQSESVERLCFDRGQLDTLASKLKWHPFLQSSSMFLLTCAGRTQDMFNVDTKNFYNALVNHEPMLIPPRDKKTIVQHWYFPDKESTALILPFV